MVVLSLGSIMAAVTALMGYQAYRAFQDSPDHLKDKFHLEFPGLGDASALTTDQRSQVVEAANKERCTCGCGFTLAACLAEDSTCPRRRTNLHRIEELVVLAANPKR